MSTEVERARRRCRDRSFTALRLAHQGRYTELYEAARAGSATRASAVSLARGALSREFPDEFHKIYDDQLEEEGLPARRNSGRKMGVWVPGQTVSLDEDDDL